MVEGGRSTPQRRRGFQHLKAVQELAMPDPIKSNWITNYIVTHNLSFPLDYADDGNTFCMYKHFFFLYFWLPGTCCVHETQWEDRGPVSMVWN